MIKTFAEGNPTLVPGDVAHFLWGGCDWASWSLGAGLSTRSKRSSATTNRLCIYSRRNPHPQEISREEHHGLIAEILPPV